ncbi:phospholipase D family protein [Hyphomicrobiales bacterium]|uniref:phospholipase D family protein n=1 Tax=Agrobacterium cavarae TaxID=2528239 RepID=UPI000DDB2328
MKLLTEIEAPEAIKKLLADAETAKFAVAFWGKGASAKLGISESAKPLKIICNLQSGACNPTEIRELLKLAPSVEVRTNPRLHAKVYWTPTGVVVGSSNASANGLAVEGNELSSWSEANVYTSDHAMLSQSSEWFDKQFDQSQSISDADLLQAEEVWNRRQYNRPLVFSKNASLIQLVRDNIDHSIWKTVKVTCWQDDISEDAASRLSAIAANHPSADELLAYEGWEDYLKEGDWTFDFYINPNSTISFNDIWKIQRYLPSSPDLSLAIKSSALDLIGFGSIKPTKDDLAGLKRAALHFLNERKDLKLKAQDERNAIFDIAEAVEYLSESTNNAKPTAMRKSALEKEFEEAMQNVYDEAKKIGHNATKFLGMLHADGAVKTAQKLVTGSASETFTKFLLKGRKDLTVEALVVQERWKPLFSESVITAAKKRLGQ